jgi:hypothetical protein
LTVESGGPPESAAVVDGENRGSTPIVESGGPPDLAAALVGDDGGCECWQLHALALPPPLWLTLLSPAAGASLPLRLDCPLDARG